MTLCGFNEDLIYSLGGENKENLILDLIEKYDLKRNIWSILDVKLPVKVECVACFQSNDCCLLIFGGYTLKHGLIDDIFELNLPKDKITAVKGAKLVNCGYSVHNIIFSSVNIANIFLGGEEDTPPIHFTYKYN